MFSLQMQTLIYDKQLKKQIDGRLKETDMWLLVI